MHKLPARRYGHGRCCYVTLLPERLTQQWLCLGLIRIVFCLQPSEVGYNYYIQCHNIILFVH